MKRIDRKEQLEVIGGNITYSATLVNAICRVVELIFTIGENVGSSIRRNVEKEICPIK